jgi:hypothetical protein
MPYFKACAAISGNAEKFLFYISIMKKGPLYLALFFLCLSCKKEKVVVITPALSKADSEITIDKVINDSTIVLKWSKYEGKDFQKYLLVRHATYVNNGQFGDFVEIVDSSNDANHLSFTERNMPFASNIRYDLFVMKSNGGPTLDNVYYERPNSLIYGIPTDVLFSSAEKRLYVTFKDRITLVDCITGRQIISKEFPATIGFCGLGDYNGNKELYVPVNDGWLHILDAGTLQLKDKIYIAGSAIGSVVAISGKLYVSSSDVSALITNCIKIYDRASKTLTARTGFRDRTRLVPLEATSVEIIELTLDPSPVDLAYYQFSATGVLISKKQGYGSYMTDSRIVRSFPDGSKFITSLSGTIFYKSLVFDRSLKEHANYSDFAFNADGSIIYASIGLEQKINVITYPAATTISSYATSFYPYKIFRDGNALVCVSKTYINQQNTYLFIEKVNL